MISVLETDTDESLFNVSLIVNGQQSATEQDPERSCRISNVGSIPPFAFPFSSKVVVVPLVEFVHLVFTRMPGESYRRRLRLYLCCIFRELINSLVCWFCEGAKSEDSVHKPQLLKRKERQTRESNRHLLTTVFFKNTKEIRGLCASARLSG